MCPQASKAHVGHTHASLVCAIKGGHALCKLGPRRLVGLKDRQHDIGPRSVEGRVEVAGGPVRVGQHRHCARAARTRSLTSALFRRPPFAHTCRSAPQPLTRHSTRLSLQALLVVRRRLDKVFRAEPIRVHPVVRLAVMVEELGEVHPLAARPAHVGRVRVAVRVPRVVEA